MQRDRIVYVPGVFDLLHHGHINIIEVAKSQGGVVVVGLLTDEAAESYKCTPVLAYADRARVVGALRDVDVVLPQATHDCVPMINLLRPRALVHGRPLQADIRKETIEALRVCGGRLIEVPSTEGISSTRLRESLAKGRKL